MKSISTLTPEEQRVVIDAYSSVGRVFLVGVAASALAGFSASRIQRLPITHPEKHDEIEIGEVKPTARGDPGRGVYVCSILYTGKVTHNNVFLS